MNLAFYVSRKATRLNKILDINNMDLLHSIKVVFSDDRETLYLKDKIEKLNISYILYDYKEIAAERGKKNLLLSEKLLAILKEYNIDYCFSFGVHILEGELLREYKNRIINFHPSILPSFAGRNSIDQAIEAKVNLLGNTAHFIDAGIDTGPKILQSVVPAVAYYEGGYDAILDIQIKMLCLIFDLLKAGRIVVVDNKVKIVGADYNSYSIFPHIGLDISSNGGQG